MIHILIEMITYVIGSLVHNWFPLTFAILVAAFMKVHINPEKLKQAIFKKRHVSIVGSVIVGALTPLCACGTMAVIIGMLATTLPWGPVMAFLTSSPLMSPDGFILLSGIISLKFAIAMTIASIVIGIGAGYITHIIETKTNFLNNQTRFSEKKLSINSKEGCGCQSVSEPVNLSSCCSAPKKINLVQLCCEGASGNTTSFEQTYSRKDLSWNELSLTGLNSTLNAKMYSTINVCFKFLWKIKWTEISREIFETGLKQIVLYFSIFVAIGYLINRFVPSSYIVALFSGENIFSVPLAAIIGLPLYINGESSLPLIKALLDGGAGAGAMLAFLITGPGTSAGVISGLTVFLKKRAILLYIFFILWGAILLGYTYDFLLLSGVI